MAFYDSGKGTTSVYTLRGRTEATPLFPMIECRGHGHLHVWLRPDTTPLSWGQRASDHGDWPLGAVTMTTAQPCRLVLSKLRCPVWAAGANWGCRGSKHSVVTAEPTSASWLAVR